jgi:tritrans,polycis-undecaprenyl-diphosphate synthase [geranylgeranyl-diphosphate specific]
MDDKKKGASSRTHLSDILATTAQAALESALLKELKEGPIPHHVAIIMDGNRRFAKEQGIMTEEGHLKGKEKLEELMNWCLEVGVKILTVYALSTENLSRPKDEVEKLMDLFVQSFRAVGDDPRVHKYGIRVKAIGDREKLRPDVQEAIQYAEEKTKSYTNYTYNIAVAYGGREEILQAMRAIARDVAKGLVKPEEIDEKMISKRLYTPDIPDPDLVFRTSGEERISNFLLWQVAYAELYFSDVLWPGLRKIDFLRAIHDYQRRQRRYGT